MLDQFLTNEGVEAINSFMPKDVLVSIGTSPSLRPWADELRRGAHVRQALMLLRQRVIKMVSDRLEHRHVEGLGQKVATIDPEIYEQMRLLYGPDCWRDKEFLHDTLEKNPHLRVRCEPGKTTVLVNGLRGQKSEVRDQRGADRTDGSTNSHRMNERANGVGASLVSDLPAVTPAATTSGRLEIATR